MILSDIDILDAMRSTAIVLEREGDILIPSDLEGTPMLQPASIDLSLAPEFICGPNLDSTLHLSNITVMPGSFILGCTLEELTIDNTLVARVEGKSSLGRLGISVHITAGFIDPGFSGQVTLEIVNHGKRPVNLKSHSPICQVCFTPLQTPSTRPYGSPGLNSHYMNQVGVAPSAWRTE